MGPCTFYTSLAIEIFINDPVAQKLLALYPLPNQAGTSDGRNNFFYSRKALEDYYVHLARVDHAFSENHRLFARLHYDYWNEDKDRWFGESTGIVLNRINRTVPDRIRPL